MSRANRFDCVGIVLTRKGGTGYSAQTIALRTSPKTNRPKSALSNNDPPPKDASADAQPPSQPTLQHIAQRSGVSATTISRVLTGQADRYRISKDTEAEVRRVAKEFNFIPNQLARGLRLK